MHVVDQQQVGGAQLVLEGRPGAIHHRPHKALQKAFGGQIDHLAAGRGPHGLPGDGVEQVGLTEAVGAVEHHRIEMAIAPAADALGHGVGEFIGRARHEGIEAKAVLQAGRTGLGRFGRGRARRLIHGGRRGARQGLEGHLRRGADRGLARGAGDVKFGPGLQLQGAALRIILRPQLGHAAPGVASHPVAGDARRRDQIKLACGAFTHPRLGQPGIERVLAHFAFQSGGGLGPHRFQLLAARTARQTANTPRKVHGHIASTPKSVSNRPVPATADPLKNRTKAPSPGGCIQPPAPFIRTEMEAPLSLMLARDKGRSTGILSTVDGYFD